AEKRLANVAGVAPLYENAAVSGYEIHIGQSVGGDCARPWLDFGGRAEGAMNAAGTVMGCYIHGLFASDTFRAAFLRAGGAESLNTGFEAGVNRALDDLASHIETHLDVDGIFSLAK
ncbi:MAG: cobyric acid synthase CobQ, partial [Proteobacteria bacterium]|nr:cobyric acid synthase CobQ [Pseudomonadota bacterium]